MRASLVKNLVTGIVIGIFSHYVGRIKGVHDGLAAQIDYDLQIGQADTLLEHCSAAAFLPQYLKRQDSQYILLCDESSKVTKRSSLPSWSQDKLLTTYLRHNLQVFASLPQAWILWFTADGPSRVTFTPSWIATLNFEEGDQVCGSYSVRHRAPGRVEMSMRIGDPVDPKFVEARLIISLSLDKSSDEATFKTQTLMWRREDSGSLMPLERSFPGWVHKLTSWWLIFQGINHLQDIKRAKAP